MYFRYQIYNFVGNKGTVAYFTKLSDAVTAVNRIITETNGKCDLLIRKYSKTYKTYVLERYCGNKIQEVNNNG